MKVYEIGFGVIAAVVAGAVGLAALPIALQGRTAPFVVLGNHVLGAASEGDVEGKIRVYEQELQNKTVVLRLGEEEAEITLAELGAAVDVEKTREKIMSAPFIALPLEPVSVAPIYSIDDEVLHDAVYARFGERLNLPKDASLQVTSGVGLLLVESAPGQKIDTVTLAEDLRIKANNNTAIDLNVISAQADVQDSEVEVARAFAQTLLTDGFTLSFEDTEIAIKPYSIRRLLSFMPVVESESSDNKVLGVTFDEVELEAYLENTVIPEIDQEAIDARFEVVDSEQGPVAVSQFATAERGQKLDMAATAKRIEEALAKQQNRSELAVEVTEPNVTTVEDMERLGIKTLLAQGESDFKGSPPNRVHNIRVGAAKYNGVLIPPGGEFSFLRYLGPVTAEAGFKPELVIKSNVTIPEYGGGLCQVSSTAFRAAINSGLEITQRRNHSYAVSYYGTPGFDATIYPPYTDLRFLNNTPGYILVQTKIIGTRLLFDFWGTDDGREVKVAGPTPYDRQSNGAVKATLTQVVTKNGEPVLEDTFYSNYKSPELFPKVLAANGEATPAPSAPPTPPVEQPKSPTNVTPTPAASASPAPKN